MAQIRPRIADVSHRAMWWWDTLVTMTTQRYQQWLGNDPITRLIVQPPTVEELPQGFTRLEQRVTSLLMQAIPKTLAAEMIANRQLGAVQIIFKVMKVYQPRRLGGASEHPASPYNDPTCRDVSGSFHVFENAAASPFTS